MRRVVCKLNICTFFVSFPSLLAHPYIEYITCRDIDNNSSQRREANAARGSTLDVIRHVRIWARILVQVTIYRRLLIGRDGHLDQSEAYDIS